MWTHMEETIMLTPITLISLTHSKIKENHKKTIPWNSKTDQNLD